MYKTAEHKDYFFAQDEATKNRFDLVRKLSKGYTVENEMARQLDTMLMEFKDIDERNTPAAAQAKPKPVTQPSKPSSPIKKPAASQELHQSFNELFEELKAHAANSAVSFQPNGEQLKQALHETLKEVKIRFGDLDTDVQKRFSALPIKLSYELPDKTLPTFTKPPIDEFQQMIDDTMMGNNVLLVGGAGTGKTFTAENLIAKNALGREHITINCSQWTSPTEIIGGQTMDGYVEGKLIEAWKHGWVLILDELPKIDPNTAGLFNDALSKTKLDNATIFNARKESFKKHKDFACIATGNIYPDKESMSYGANNKQDLSLLDRFSGSVYFIEKNPAIERQIVLNDMIWSICDRTRSVIEELKYEAQLSLRFMQTARDAFALEMKRLRSNKPNGIKPNEGKTFKSALDSYLSPFTELQRGNIRSKIGYDKIFNNYAYRSWDTNKMAY